MDVCEHFEGHSGVSLHRELRSSPYGPTYARITAPLRSLLKPRAAFPPSEEQRAAIEAVKE